MAVSLNMGVEAVSYQPSIGSSPTDYPRSKVNLPIGASIPSHVDRVFGLDSSEAFLAKAVAPRLANPYITVPARYKELFGEIEAATSDHANSSDDAAQVVLSARALLIAMRSEFEALETSRNALVKA